MCDLLAMFRAAACGRQPVPEGAADTGKPSYFSVCCGKASNPVVSDQLPVVSWSSSGTGGGCLLQRNRGFQSFAGFKVSTASARFLAKRTREGNPFQRHFLYASGQ